MAEPIRDPEKLQGQLEEFQNMQRQLQMYSMQRQQLSMQLEVMKMAVLLEVAVRLARILLELDQRRMPPREVATTPLMRL